MTGQKGEVAQGQSGGSVPFISATIPTKICALAAVSDTLMREEPEPPMSEACFHVVTEADEISSLEDLNCI